MWLMLDGSAVIKLQRIPFESVTQATYFSKHHPKV